MVTGNNNTLLKSSQYWDKRIQKEKAPSYKLLLNFSNKNFLFSIFDTTNNEFLVAKYEIFNDLNDLLVILKDEVFSWDFQYVIISVETIKSTIIPNSFYDKKIIEKYLYFDTEINKDELKITNDELKYIDATLIYSLQKEVKSILEKKFKNIIIKSQASIFIDSILKKSAQSKQNSVFIDVSNKSFEIAVIKKSELYLYNKFIFSTKEDFLYYVLNCYNTLNLDSKKDKLQISGEFNKDEIFNSLKEYIHLVDLEKRESLYKYSNVFNSVPEFYFHKLFNIIKCV